MKFLVPVDLSQNELQNARIQNLATAPSSPVNGQVYFNTTNNKAMVYDGTNWIPWEASVNAVTGVKGNSESTYRTGDVNITASNIGLGNVGNFKAVSTAASQGLTTTEQSNARNNIGLGTAATYGIISAASGITSSATNLVQGKAVADYVSTAIGGVDAMRFKGTIGTGGTVTTLPTTGVKVGDTYRVITAGTYAGQTCEVGDLIIATATTPTWTVAQTNIDGAITSLTGTSPISVTGSGSSRTIEHSNSGVTADTYTPSRSGAITYFPTFTVDAKGHITAATNTSFSISSIGNGSGKLISDEAYRAGVRSANGTTSSSTFILSAGDTIKTISLSDLSTSFTVVDVNCIDMTTKEPVIVDWSLNVLNGYSNMGSITLTVSIASAYANDILINPLVSYAATM